MRLPEQIVDFGQTDGWVPSEKQLKMIISIQRWWRSTNPKQRKQRYAFHLATTLAQRGGGGKDDDKRMDLKYWIEAADPKHRYGSYLSEYYLEWLNSESRDGFFHWLDYGGGKTLDLEHAPRSKLKVSKVAYWGEADRLEHQVGFSEDDDGNVLLYWMNSSADGHHQAGDLLDTDVLRCPWIYRTGFPTSWIFVVDLKWRLFVNKKETGRFHHSSFLSGHACHCAGGIAVSDGSLVAVNGNSGHYKPNARMMEKTWHERFAEEYGLDPDSFYLVYPRMRKPLGPLTPKCMKPMASNFPC